MRKLSFLLAFSMFMLSSFSVFQIDKNAFYKALSAGSEEIIDNELKGLDQARPSSQVSAYQGALLMKKAGFVKGVKGKVKIFKLGAKKLEEEIDKNASNVEYRFLRLTIQEHAPGILHYNKELNKDKAAIITGFEKLDTTLKSIIASYAQSSKVLNESDLRGK